MNSQMQHGSRFLSTYSQSRTRNVAVLTVLCLLAGWQAEVVASNPRRTPVVEAVARVQDAVVNIHSERTVENNKVHELFSHSPLQNRINGMGTGIVIDERGYIVTNYHVVANVNMIEIRFRDNRSYPARIVARDRGSDLALLKVDTERKLKVMPLGTARDLMVGETVIAIGNAYGYPFTVTKGIVSAINRDVTLNKEISYKSLIQTDAAINPGNSGGPLVNIFGELVGVNVAIRAGAQGISFAIPVETMIDVASDFFSTQKRGIGHGLLLHDRIAYEADHRIRRELVVDAVEIGTPAAQAGLQAGDQIVEVDDFKVHCRLDFERALYERTPGDTVTLRIRRRGNDQLVPLVLGKTEIPAIVQAETIWDRLGLRLDAADGQLVKLVSRKLHGGMRVLDVKPDSPAKKAGIRVNDILIGLHTWETVTIDNVNFVLNHPDLPSFCPLKFYIVRDGQIHRGWFKDIPK
ncbi:MAG: serine protease [Gemmatales bacterium]|nr:MAG: serine protease [Gemmatales bacterium]